MQTELDQALRGAAEMISTIAELRDPFTHMHERRVSEVAVATAIAEELRLDANRVEGIRIAAGLHDIGKIGTPAEIISKPGRLTPNEFEFIKLHAQQGYEILKGVNFPWPLAQVALQHHERLDGSGYPQGLKGDAIILEARIIAVADVVEAMASHRPYRQALGVEEALGEIERGRGVTFDPAVADACLRLFRDKGYKIPG